ncbi:hypothetical protein [Falsiroseomonas sp.]
MDKETHTASNDALEGARGHRRHVHLKADICDAEEVRAAFSK